MAKRGLCMTQTGTPYYASPEAVDGYVCGGGEGE